MKESLKDLSSDFWPIFEFQVLKNRECPEFLFKVKMIKKQVQDLSMHIKIFFRRKKKRIERLVQKKKK